MLIEETAVSLGKISGYGTGWSSRPVGAPTAALLAEPLSRPRGIGIPSAVLQLRQDQGMRRCHVDAAEVLADVHGLVRFVGIINAGQPLQGDQPQIRTWLDEREHSARRPPEVEVIPGIGLRRSHALLL